MSLSKPYYQDDYCTIYHGDCREILPQLPKVDLVLTDPPYGIDNSEPIENTIEAVFLASERCSAMAILLDWHFAHKVCLALDGFKVGELVWEYGWISGGRSKAKCGILPTHNIIHCFGDTASFHFTNGSIIKRQPGFSSPRQCSYANKTGHKYEKPSKLFIYLLEHIDGNLILDPFLGSGTTAYCAKKLGRRCIGIEIEEKYCEIAAKRLAQEVLPLK